MSVVFLDRDGVINENIAGDYVKHRDEFVFLPGSCAAIARLTAAGHRIVICTNQAGIASGRLSLAAIHDIHQWMLTQIQRTGGDVAGIYYCPHGKLENCMCRKPLPGLLLQARADLNLDLRDAVFVGDAISDVQAALAARVQPVLVLTGRGRDQLRNHAQDVKQPFFVADDLYHATENILQGRYAACAYELAG